MTPTLPTDGFRRIAQLTIAALAVLAVVSSPAAAAAPADAGGDALSATPADVGLSVDRTAAEFGGDDLAISEDEEGGWRVAVKKFENTSSY